MKAVSLSTDTAALQATAMFAVAIKFAGVGNGAIVIDEASIFSVFLIVSFRLAIRGASVINRRHSFGSVWQSPHTRLGWLISCSWVSSFTSFKPYSHEVLGDNWGGGGEFVYLSCRVARGSTSSNKAGHNPDQFLHSESLNDAVMRRLRTSGKLPEIEPNYPTTSGPAGNSSVSGMVSDCTENFLNLSIVSSEACMGWNFADRAYGFFGARTRRFPYRCIRMCWRTICLKIEQLFEPEA